MTVLLSSCLTGLGESVLQIKTKIDSSHTAVSKPLKQEVNGREILPTFVFPEKGIDILHQIVVPQFSSDITTQPRLCQ
jgi:hypothetical protein